MGKGGSRGLINYIVYKPPIYTLFGNPSTDLTSKLGKPSIFFF